MCYHPSHFATVSAICGRFDSACPRCLSPLVRISWTFPLKNVSCLVTANSRSFFDESAFVFLSHLPMTLLVAPYGRPTGNWFHCSLYVCVTLWISETGRKQRRRNTEKAPIGDFVWLNHTQFFEFFCVKTPAQYLFMSFNIFSYEFFVFFLLFDYVVISYSNSALSSLIVQRQKFVRARYN